MKTVKPKRLGRPKGSKNVKQPKSVVVEGSAPRTLALSDWQSSLLQAAGVFGAGSVATFVVSQYNALDPEVQKAVQALLASVLVFVGTMFKKYFTDTRKTV